MANKIRIKSSSVVSKVPLNTDLDYGELAINYADGKLYYKTSSNTIQHFPAVPLADSLYVNVTGDTMTGDLTINGSLAATSKSFLINHPTIPNAKLQYGSLESPYHGVRLTGTGEIENCVGKVCLPDYIGTLCQEEGVNIQITNIGHGQVIWVDEINLKENYFTVKMRKPRSESKKYGFFWSFTAIRKDVSPLKVEIGE